MADSSGNQLSEAMLSMAETGQHQLRAERYDQAEMTFRILLERFDAGEAARSFFLTRLAEALFQQGKFGEAETAFTEATVANPQSPQAWYAMASFLAKREKLPASKQACARALELLQHTTDPDQFELLDLVTRLMKWHLDSQPAQTDWRPFGQQLDSN